MNNLRNKQIIGLVSGGWRARDDESGHWEIQIVLY